MIKTKVWIAVIVLLLVACIVASVLIFLPKKEGKRLEVYVDDELVFSQDLRKVTEPYEKTIETENGLNVLEIANGKVRIKDADCDGKDCVKTGWIHSSNVPIVCLPHRVVVKIVGEEDFDAVSK